MGIAAAVVGASGYAGGELLRLLVAHPEIEIGPLAARSAAGSAVTDVHPHLVSLQDHTFVSVDELLASSDRVPDLVFLALPHGESGRIAAQLPDSVRVLDLGADHRLTDPHAWAAGYGGEYAGAWPYGLPELPGARDAIRRASRIAVPGCYPTATILALAPLLAAGLVTGDDVVVVAASGTSGAGRTPKPHLLGSEVMSNVSAYKVGDHQHRHEMAQALGLEALSFTPLLVPMPRGMLATCTAKVAPGVDAAQLRQALADAYDGEPFVRVLSEGRWPQAGATAGTNTCHLQVTLDEAAGRAVVISAIDNLGKGAAGQAVQCANLVLGLPETSGLAVDGVAP
jgi:N-acetyl-gamma-glutamyl-phosphate reductase